MPCTEEVTDEETREMLQRTLVITADPVRDENGEIVLRDGAPVYEQRNLHLSRGLLDALAHPGVLPGALLHALDVKAVLNGADGLVEQRPGIPAYLRHGGFDVARVGRTHPAAAIVAAAVAFADSAELRG